MTPVADGRGPALVRALLATATWLAVVVALTGFISLLLDLDVVAAAEAGPLLQPVVVLVAGAVVLARLLAVERRAATGEAVPVVAVALGAGALVHVVGTALPAAWLILVTGAPIAALAFGAASALGPFTAALSVSAAVAAALYAGVARRRASGAGPAQWPGERRG